MYFEIPETEIIAYSTDELKLNLKIANVFMKIIYRTGISLTSSTFLRYLNIAGIIKE